ncbi:MAG: helix-turn-helix domain-containing protein [Butyrivibrio sp.]|uniref:helix-turn-helix transcriptional regulator n=1 Tax=Butyrivibrio sp. TaxID=28121 RepID=UPI001B01E5B7|nr:helix-turn-helix domain-containing protein [Butyrivibrio sp.]MBO6242108.1 helix-turn-helix domain-containing protein [Butyrivibrio sp.]
MADTPLSQYLRLLRSKHDYKQDDVAKYLGVTRATYSHYENARLIPPTDSLYKLSSYYKVSLNKLVKLAIMSSNNGKTNEKAAEYITSDEEIESKFDILYKDFLVECADMTPDDLNKWSSIEDREIIYYYHKLKGQSKRLLNYVLRIMCLKDSFDNE